MNFEIIGTGMAVPPRRVTNDELAKIVDTSDEWIKSHTGIGSRHVSDDDCPTSKLGIEAGKQALAMAFPGKTAEEAALSIDMIVVATATPDYYGSPSTACIVQHHLGAKNAGAMDVTAGCTSFIYALETAVGLLAAGDRRYILVIGAEELTKFADWGDRGSCVLFGDGAGAVILEKTNSTGENKRGVIRTLLKADGSGAEHIVFTKGGTLKPIKKGDIMDEPVYLKMNGQAVYNFAVKALTDSITGILSLEGLSIEDIACIIPHQANVRIIKAAEKRLKIPEGKCYVNMEEYANTSAASIPICLDELNRAGRLKKGDRILTVGFGSGLTYGANLIVW